MPEPIVVALDPATAYVMFATELVKLIRVMIEGQSKEQQQIFWQRYLDDTAKVRGWLKLEG